MWKDSWPRNWVKGSGSDQKSLEELDAWARETCKHEYLRELSEGVYVHIPLANLKPD